MWTLVTGAGGHLGHAVVRALLQRGRKVRALVRGRGRLESLPQGVEICYGDVLDRWSLRKALEGVSVVYHLAGVYKTRLVDESVMLETNVRGTENVIEVCAFSGSVRRLVLTSSVAAVGYLRQAEGALDESSWNRDPIDAYSSSKLEAEHVARQLMRRLGLPIIFVNPATVLGPWDWGPTPSNGFILWAMRKTPPVWFEGGHSYTDVEDVAEGHVLAEEKGRPGERYILSGENIHNRDLFQRIARLRGARPPWFKIGHRFVEWAGLAVEAKAKLFGGAPLFTRQKAHQLIGYYGYYDCSKAQKELGYRFRPLDQILPRCAEWFALRGWLGD